MSLKNITKSVGDRAIVLPDGENTVIKGIKCKDCNEFLPSMTIRQYLDGDLIQEYRHLPREKAIILN